MIIKFFINFTKSLFILFLLLNFISCDNKTSENASQEMEKLKEENSELEKKLLTKDSTDTPKTKVYSTEIKSLDDFQNSQFFEKYNCYKSDSWLLKNGLTNYYFETNLQPTASIDFSVLNNKFRQFGITFYYRDELNENDYIFINNLLAEFNLGSHKEKVYSFIRRNIETSLEQINKSKSMMVGNLKFRAGKVSEQILTIESD